MTKNRTVQLSASEVRLPQVELRTGAPYASLIAHHLQFASTVAEYFGVDPGQVIPTAGATGGIEAVRNYVFRSALKPAPVLLTVSPGYWRARESFEGFGFNVCAIETGPEFEIKEPALIKKAAEIDPDVIYLSLPNNPTGAVFDPERIVRGVPESTAVLLDLTLPSRQLDTRTLKRKLLREFRGRKKLFLVGSTSKSHNTAEYRIGWVICASAEGAARLKQENRNVVSSVSVSHALERLQTGASVTELIAQSFALLRAAENHGGFEVIKPPRMAETGYVLIRPIADSSCVRSCLERSAISVMWGSECGITDEYIRLETSEPENIELLINALKSSLKKKQSA
jgi:histidinol-phosphate/aromatic aminotransferase/cobyric acid decarboxylase-like protein